MDIQHFLLVAGLFNRQPCHMDEILILHWETNRLTIELDGKSI